jgi:hypothetical protein
MTEAPPARKISDLRCPCCWLSPALIRTTERDIGNPDDPSRWKALIGCQGCGVLISHTGPAEQDAIDRAVSRWHGSHPQP